MHQISTGAPFELRPAPQLVMHGLSYATCVGLNLGILCKHNFRLDLLR